ncbi:MAG TPA: hypothetical protein VFR15_11060 [Chloroflexia bacterium]|nr:hypothetical protein [Chloroflexia bacterium]
MPHLVVLAAFALLSIVATWPLFPQLGGYVIDKGDPLYSVWAMAWQAHVLVTDPLNLFNANTMHPFQGVLAFDELSFTEAVLAAPVYYITGNPVLSHNLLLLATFVLSGYGAWLLVRDLTGSGWAGFVAGAAFALSFYRLNHLPHQTLINTQWMPLLLVASYKLLWTGMWKWAWALSGLFVLQALSGHYLAFYSAMLVGLFFVFYGVIERKRVSRRLVGQLVAAGVVAALVMAPVAVPYVLLQGGYEFTRNLFEVERFSNTLSSFLGMFRGNPLLRALLEPFADKGPWAIERAAFPGITVVVLSIVAVVAVLRGRRRGVSPSQPADVRAQYGRLGKHVAFFVLIALLSALLSLGPSLQITYAPDNYDPNAIRRIIPLPYLILHEWVPGFQSMRVVARIGVLTALALAVLAGIGAHFFLDQLARREGRGARPRWAVPALAVVLAILPAVESWTVPVSMAAVGTRGAVPPAYRWLGEQPDTVIVEYPMTYYRPGDPNVEMANLYQYYSVYHWHKTINASTTIRPYAYSAVVLETEDCFPCPRSLDVLYALDVEYVLVHLENLSGPQRTDFDWRSTDPVAKVVDDFILAQDFGADRIYRLAPRQVTELEQVIPRGASVLLASPRTDPITGGDPSVRVSGGYPAALGYMLDGRTQYGDARLAMGQEIRPLDPANPPEYAILWTREDPADYGYAGAPAVWSNEHVTVYRRGPAVGHAGR